MQSHNPLKAQRQTFTAKGQSGRQDGWSASSSLMSTQNHRLITINSGATTAVA